MFLWVPSWASYRFSRSWRSCLKPSRFSWMQASRAPSSEVTRYSSRFALIIVKSFSGKQPRSLPRGAPVAAPGQTGLKLRAVFFFGAWTWLVALTLTAVYSIAALLTLWLPSGPRIYQKLARSWSRSIFRFSGLKIDVEAHPEARSVPQAVFMANHTSAVDIISIFVAIPQHLCFIAKDILFKIPLLGWSMSLAGFVSVERGNSHSGREAVGKLEQRLREGWSVSIFPEGTRSRSGELLPFKKSGFLLGLRTGIPIVPIGISGAREIIGKEGIRIRPGRVKVRVGRPIQTTGLAFEDRNTLADEVRREILRLSAAE